MHVYRYMYMYIYVYSNLYIYYVHTFLYMGAAAWGGHILLVKKVLKMGCPVDLVVSVLQHVAACCSVMQCDAACCSVM